MKHAIVTRALLARGYQVPAQVKVWEFESAFALFPDTALPPLQKTSDLAYVIFTSGSTGFPKGVMIDHTGALNTCLDINERFSISEKDSVLAISALYFDLSVYDVFGILGAGGKLIYPDSAQEKDPGHWVELMQKHKVTVWNSVPELASMLIEYNELVSKARFSQLKVVLMSGDWIPVTLPDKIKVAAPTAQVVSLGGATEASIWSIFYEIQEVKEDWKSIPYGKALKNQTMHVLNKNLEPCPFHVIGDIYIGGVGVAKGYLKDEEKTRAQFIKHPQTQEVIYKTGDLGRLLPDGNIEFLGREDFQVKVQGYRIELGEIESVVTRHEKVKAAAVDVKTDPSGRQYLLGYIVSREESLSAEVLQNYLGLHLPGYMVPARYVFMDQLPVTNNGKIDRKQLPAPLSPQVAGSKSEVAISSTLAGQLKELWKELLPVALVGADDDFFALGGNSILAIRLVARLQEVLQVKVSISQLLSNSTFTDLLQEIVNKTVPEKNVSNITDEGRNGASDTRETQALTDVRDSYPDTTSDAEQPKSIVPINRKGEERPLFLVHPIGGSVFSYTKLSKALGKSQPLYAFQSVGLDAKATPLRSISQMAKKYMAEMKEIQPEGPYRIGGWSFGGLVAFEMAQQLEAAGEQVESLYLIDSYFHKDGYSFEHAPTTTLFAHFLKNLALQFHKEATIVESDMEHMLQQAVEQQLLSTGMDIAYLSQVLEVFKSNCIAYTRYQAGAKVTCPTVQLIAESTSYIGSEAEAQRWQLWVEGDLHTQTIPGDHFTIFDDQNISKIAQQLSAKAVLSRRA